MANANFEQRLVLRAGTAAELMTSNPISIQADHSVRSATAFLVDKRFSAAPVIDEAGKPLGVLSQTDLIIHQREALAVAPAAGNYYERDELDLDAASLMEAGIESAELDETFVRDVMTPIVLAVSPTTSASKVVEQLLVNRVHRLFVVDDAGVLVGVISTVDILKKLQPAVDDNLSRVHPGTKGVR